MQQCKDTTSTEEEKTIKTATGEVKVFPTKFGEKVTGDHFIKNGHESAEEEDPNFPSDTVAVALYDRATRWLAVYLKSAKTTYHTIAAMQRFAVSWQCARVDLRGDRVELEVGHRHHGDAAD